MDMNKKSQKLLNFFNAKFNCSQQFSLEDYLHAFGNERDALLYFTLFFPELTEIENSIFLKRMVIDPDKLRKEIGDSHKPIHEIEINYNFVEVGYLFDCTGRNISDEEEDLLAETIKIGWSASLNLNYPCRSFCVEILSPEKTGSTIGVQFHEQRASGK